MLRREKRVWAIPCAAVEDEGVKLDENCRCGRSEIGQRHCHTAFFKREYVRRHNPYIT